jgi:NADPH2:quinone reductase
LKAITIERTGGPDVLQPTEMESVSPGPGQVAIDVAYAGVNFIDTYQRTGAYPVPLPFVPGLEGSGRISALGENADAFAVGQRVAWRAASGGGYAQQIVTGVDDVVAIPDEVDDASAAALLFQGLTAHYLATSTYPVNSGDVVVIHAAAGGVGLLLTQIVKRRGGVVVGTVSRPDKAELARSIGADHVVAYDEFPTRVADITDGAGAAAVFDGVGRDTFDASLAALKVRGTLVLYGASSGPVPPVDPMRLNFGGSLYLTRPTMVHYVTTGAEMRQRANELFAWLSSNQLRLSIGRTYALADAGQAHEDLEARNSVGKLLLDVTMSPSDRT